MSYIMYGECATVKSRFGIVVLQQYDIFAPLLPESNIVPPQAHMTSTMVLAVTPYSVSPYSTLGGICW